MTADPGPTRRALMCGAAAAGLTACQPRAPTGQSAFAFLVDTITRDIVTDAPERAALLGAPRDVAPEALGYGLDARGPLAEELRRTAALRWSAQLAGFDAATLSPSERTTQRALALRFAQARECATAPFGRLSLYTAFRPFALTPGETAIENVSRLLSQSGGAERADVEALLERFSKFPAAVAGEREDALADARRGVTPPAFAVDAFAALLAGAADGPEPGGRALAIARSRIAGLKGGDPGGRLTFAAQRIGRELAAAFAATAAALPGLRGPERGLSALPNGREVYVATLAFATGFAIDPEAARAEAEADLAEAAARLDMALRGAGLTDGAPGERLAAFAADPAAALAPGALQGSAGDLAAKLRQLAPRAFAVIPEDWPGVSLQRGQETLARYMPRRLDGGGQPRLSLAAEGIGRLDAARLMAGALLGRHMAFERAMRERTLPLARRLISSTGFADGFAAYAEGVADDLGFFQDDPIAALGRQRHLALLAARLRVDIGVHWEGWSLDQAAERLVRAAGVTPEAARAQAQGIMVRPGAAAAAELGRKAFVAIRESARTKRGTRFDIRALHDLLTREGEAPLATLQGLAQAWSVDGAA